MNLQKDGIRLHKSNFNAIGQQIQPMLESGDCYRLIIKPWKEKRSLSQNSLMWMWNGDVATAVNLHSSTKLLDTEEMTFYLRRIEVWCIERGIKLRIPANSEYHAKGNDHV